MQLDSAFGIELESFVDLVRLVTSSSPDRPSTIFKWFSNDYSDVFYGSFAIFPGYYNYEGLPVLFYVNLKKAVEKDDQSIVRYDLQKTENQVSFLSHLKEKDLENIHTGLVRMCPIIKLKKAPRIFQNLN